MDAQTVSLTTAGGMLLFLAIQGFRSYQGRNTARDKAEGTVDQRAADLIVVVTKPFQDLLSQSNTMIEKERAAKERAEDARDKAVQELVTSMKDATTRYDEKVEKATTRIHDRLNKCEQEHTETKIALSASVQRVDALENRERDTLRNAPSPTQPTLVLQTPATGQTIISPGVP